MLLSKKIKNIIFDFGGVILNIDYQASIKAFEELGIRNFENLFSQATQSNIFDKLETGKIKPQEFRDEIRMLSGLKLTDEAIDIAWNKMLLDIPLERIEFLIKLKSERIHFVPPKPEDLSDLAEGLVAAHRRMDGGMVSAVIHAAAIAYGFVFLHPFEDGNGRIHRFLIHNILARRGFTPKGVMFPVSASMLKNADDYDASLEAFSRPLMALVRYSLDEDGRMTVLNDTDVWYRYMDMTPQAESLFEFIKRTIETELADELLFLANYDRAKSAIQEVVDLPDRRLDLFIRFCLQNNGRLSPRRRTKDFDFLSDEEIDRLEQAVQNSYGGLDNTRPDGGG